MNVIPLNCSSGDVVEGLRNLALRIEAGEHDVRFVVVVGVGKNARFTTWGYGPCSTLEAIGALARAVSSDLVDE